MIKNLVKMLALCWALAAVSPAYATVYTYSLADGSTLTINNVSGKGSLVNTRQGTSLTLTGNYLKNFRGVFSGDTRKNYIDLTSITGTIGGQQLEWTKTANATLPRIVFDFDPAGTSSKHIKLVYYVKSGYGGNWGVQRDYSFGVTTSTAVPEPETLALLLLGLTGLFLSSRKRQKAETDTNFGGALQPA